MNFNDQYNRYSQSGGGRKLVKRPHETPGLQSTRNTQPVYPNTNSPNYSPMYTDNSFPNANQWYEQSYTSNMQSNEYTSMPQSNEYASMQQSNEYTSMPQSNEYASIPQQNLGFNLPPQVQLFSDPLVANMASQYGNALVGSGKQFVDREISKYVPISRLRYYFAVDTSYVSKKLSIILFPFFHSDWSIRYDQNEPIQPKFDVNAADLYIPTMAFLTYILIAGLALGVKNLFSPEKLSIEASNAVAWTAFEVIIQLLTLYIANINTSLKTFDLIAYSSYKYVGIIITMLVHMILGHLGYMICLIYVSIALAFFLIRTLKLQILTEPVSSQPDMYGMPQQSRHQVGLKRRQYFLLFVACTQPLLIWWFTWRIV